MRCRHARPARAAIAALLAVAAGSPAAEEAGRERPLDLGIEEQVGVRLVLVDFLALDRRGRTVPDLAAEEIVLLVDGRQVEIASLDRDCPAGSADDPQPRAAPPPVRFTREPRKIVLAFDYYHMRHAAETLDHALQALDRWPAGDEQHMIVSLGEALRIEQPWTSDAAEVRRALERMRGDPDLYAAAHDRLTEWPFFERVQTLLDLLERVPGRKTVVLFSGPFRPDGFFHDPAHRRLAAISTVARAAIYPVDTGGLRTLVDAGPPRWGGPSELRRLANETGGRMTSDTNDLGLGYARAHRDLGCTYTLGFHDSRPRPDVARRLTLRLGRAGIRVIYPEFYLVRSSAERRRSLLRTAAVAPRVFESEAVQAELFLLGPRSGRHWRAVLGAEVRLDSLPPGGGEDWTFRVLVRKPNGTLVRSVERTLPERDASRVTLFEPLSLAPGRYSVSAVTAPPGGAEPIAASIAAEMARVPRAEPFLVGPILGSRLPGSAAPGEPSFEPLLRREVEQGSSLESLTLACVSGAALPIDVRAITRELVGPDGRRVLAFEPEPARLPDRQTACHEVLDAIPTAGLEPARYALAASAESGGRPLSGGRAEFTIVPRSTGPPVAADRQPGPSLRRGKPPCPAVTVGRAPRPSPPLGRRRSL